MAEMSSVPDWLASGIAQLMALVLVAPVAAWLTQWLSSRAERRRMRRDVLRKLAGHRYLLTQGFKGRDGEFWVALNETAVAFADDERVMERLREFHDRIQEGFKSYHLVPLVKAMAEAANLPADELDCMLIEHPFTPPTSTER